MTTSISAQLKVYRNGDITIGQTEQSATAKLAVGGLISAHGIIVPFHNESDTQTLAEDEGQGILSSVMAMDIVSYNTLKDNDGNGDKAEDTKNVHYAISPETLQMILPSLVSQEEDGTLCVDYTEIIPLLVRSIQELQHEVETLKASLASVTVQTGDAGTNSHFTAVLRQNTPNPVKEQTTIGYSLSGSFSSANISIADMYGNTVKTYPIQGGSGNITVSASELGQGMYLYSLAVDNNIVDSKKMTVTR